MRKIWKNVSKIFREFQVKIIKDLISLSNRFVENLVKILIIGKFLENVLEVLSKIYENIKKHLIKFGLRFE